jgi:hypothetical protein
MYWLPRVMAILFIGFISVFALDVFSEPMWLPALLMHSIPSFILITLTIVAWKHERLGGVIFVGVGCLWLFSSRFESLIVSIPIIVLGGLFWGSKYFI